VSIFGPLFKYSKNVSTMPAAESAQQLCKSWHLLR
jgi:hypothetical protein